jgi:hypothetical protein
MTEDEEVEVDEFVRAATWPARLGLLASTAQAMAEDMSQLYNNHVSPPAAAVTGARVLAALARDLHVQVSALNSLPQAPARTRVLQHARMLHDSCERLQARIADMTIDGMTPTPADAVAAAGLAHQAESLYLLIARGGSDLEPGTA